MLCSILISSKDAHVGIIIPKLLPLVPVCGIRLFLDCEI